MNAATPAQEEAIAARGNVLVAAGAGTGKTSTLVRRCLALLETGASLANILMVTFTDAAAAEMRRRIRETLQARAAALKSSVDTPASASLLEHLEKQLALLASANISTLHSFCLQLVREHFYELRIDPDIVVLDEQQTRPLIQQTLDALWERQYAADTPSARAAQSLVREYGRGADDWIRRLVLKLHRYTQSRPGPERWFQEQLDRFGQADPSQWRAWFVQGFEDWRRLWQPALASGVETPGIAACLKTLQNIPAETSFQCAAEAVRAVREIDGTKESWPRGSRTSVRARFEHFFDEAAFLATLTPQDARDPLVEDWESVRHHATALLELAREFTSEFNRAKRELGGVDFSDLEQFALQLLRKPDGGLTPVARQWREKLDYIFVDEYQDINGVQDAILEALSRDGERANRFLVGDVKQSIYRFRQADPGIFRGYEETWRRGENQCQRIALADNFRSRRKILDFVNALFGQLMRAGAGGVDYEALQFAESAERAALAPDETPRVELQVIAKGAGDGEANGSDDESEGEPSDTAELLGIEREARLVARRLSELRRDGHSVWDKETKRFRPVEWRDMVVLLRSPAARVEALAKEFHAFGVPLEAARGGFFESTEVSDALCLLKLIDNPLQDIPLLAVLRSPFAGLSVEELAEIRARYLDSSFWLALRRFQREPASARRDDAVARSAWSKTDLFLRQYDGWRELVRQTSVSRCLEMALAETHYLDMLLAGPRGEQRAANLRRLLDLASGYDPYQRQGVFRFLRFVETQEDAEADSGSASIEAADAVRLLSIHKSKGLEFPVVALACLGAPFHFPDLRDDVLLDETFGLALKVAPPDGAQKYPSLPHWLAVRRQRRESLGEEMRLLYVAMTRACDTLILTATARGKGNPNWNETPPGALDTREILAAKNCFDWVRHWLAGATRAQDWRSEREGASDLLRWSIYSEDDSRLRLPANFVPSEPASTRTSEADASPDQLRELISWRYPFTPATEERAKTNVTELRRRWRDETDNEAAPMPHVSPFTVQRSAASHTGAARLSPVEIGIAHHLFLQMVELERVGSGTELRQQARQLRDGGALTATEIEALDYDALEQFWQSNVGRQIRANAAQTHRELPFTARFSEGDLASAGLQTNGLAADEFVVVQGVVDLAVILPGEIWILDFKTDSVTAESWPVKAKEYEPQLKLYALALGRIYRRPVTQAWLHFLATGRTVPCAKT